MSDECCARAREESEKECNEYCTQLESQLKAANEKIEIYKSRLDKAEKLIKDFSDFGTRHDINPTGQFKSCGCFDSVDGDNWQGYIKSQDRSVRERAKEYFSDKQ